MDIIPWKTVATKVLAAPLVGKASSRFARRKTPLAAENLPVSSAAAALQWNLGNEDSEDRHP